ncbi:hypothetical protein GCM10027093_55700 [Paraburkholderia jirisanensis]
MQRVNVDRIAIERRAIVAFSVVEAAVTVRGEGAVKYRMHEGKKPGSARQTRIFPYSASASGIDGLAGDM